MGKHKIWFDKFKNLINKDNFYILMPTKSMSLNKKINTLTRFLIYFGILSFLLKGNYLYLYIPLGFISLTYFMHICSSKKDNFMIKKYKEEFNSDTETKTETKTETNAVNENKVSTPVETQNVVEEKPTHLDVSKLVEKDFSNRHIIPRQKFQDFGALAKYSSNGKILSRKLIY